MSGTLLKGVDLEFPTSVKKKKKKKKKNEKKRKEKRKKSGVKILLSKGCISKKGQGKQKKVKLPIGNSINFQTHAITLLSQTQNRLNMHIVELNIQ